MLLFGYDTNILFYIFISQQRKCYNLLKGQHGKEETAYFFKL